LVVRRRGLLARVQARVTGGARPPVTFPGVTPHWGNLSLPPTPGVGSGIRVRQDFLAWAAPRVTPVKAFRRALVAVAVAGLAAAVARLRGSGGVPPQGGGWRELSGPDLR